MRGGDALLEAPSRKRQTRRRGSSPLYCRSEQTPMTSCRVKGPKMPRPRGQSANQTGRSEGSPRTERRAGTDRARYVGGRNEVRPLGMKRERRLSWQPDQRDAADHEPGLALIFPGTDGLIQPIIAVPVHRSIRTLVLETPHQSDWLARVDRSLQSGVEGIVPRLIRRLRRRPQVLRSLVCACRRSPVKRPVPTEVKLDAPERSRPPAPEKVKRSPRSASGRSGHHQLICLVPKIETERFPYRRRRRSLHDGIRRVKRSRRRARGWKGLPPETQMLTQAVPLPTHLPVAIPATGGAWMAAVLASILDPYTVPHATPGTAP